MTDGIIKGKDLRIFANGLPIYHATECNFQSDMGIEAIATKDTEGEDGVTSNYKWNLSSKSLVANAPETHQSSKSLIQYHKEGAVLGIQFRTEEIGDFVISGNAWIKSVAIGASVEGSSTFDAGFQGKGGYTVDDYNGAGVPIITSAATASGAIGVPFTYNTIATNSPTSYAFIGQLPAGLTLNTTTGVISGTPTGSANVKIVKIQAINGTGTAEKIVEVTINPAP
ncbi:MAG: hypothetical protein EOO51_12590 [Flavobacterium sp.]|nr:MAG: hypothetical protein EOO51_12590 [Flavobacterium sp.]